MLILFRRLNHNHITTGIIMMLMLMRNLPRWCLWALRVTTWTRSQVRAVAAVVDSIGFEFVVLGAPTGDGVVDAIDAPGGPGAEDWKL